MTVLFIDGFDHYTDQLDKWDTENGAFQPNRIDTNFGRFVNGSMYLPNGTGGTGYTQTYIGEEVQEVVMGVAVYYPTVANHKLYFITAGGAIIGGVHLNGNDVLVKDSGENTITSYVGALSATTWYFLEFRVLSHGSAGEIEVHVNSVNLGTTSGMNTGGGLIADIRLQNISSAQDMWLDDLYVLSTNGAAPQNTFLGDVRVTALLPKDNGSVNNFTPTGAATQWEATNEQLHNGDTDYVESGLIGAAEDYNNNDFADLGIVPSSIFAVQTVNAAKKTDAGELRYKDEMVIAGVRYDNGTEVTAPSALYKMSTYALDLNPSTGLAWDEAGVAATGSGFTITFREI